VEGNGYLTRMIPPCFFNRNTQLAISKSVMIEPRLLRAEVQALASFKVTERLRLDRRCKVVDFEGVTDFIAAETAIRTNGQADTLPEIGSLVEFLPYISDVEALVASAVAQGQDVIVVMQHGTCVTRGYGKGEVIEWTCTTATGLKELPGIEAYEVLMVVRAMPTRTQHGPLPNEIAWPDSIPQAYGKCTGRLMRMASEPDIELLREVAAVNQASEIYLTFADFLQPESNGVTEWRHLPVKVKDFVRRLERRLSVAVRYISTGAKLDQGVWLPK
jgi:adenylosuccinate synthase